MQNDFCVLIVIVYTVQSMRWKNKKWQDAVDLLELPIQGPGLEGCGLAGRALHGEQEASRGMWSRHTDVWGLNVGSHKEHGVGRTDAALWRRLPDPGAVTSWDWSCCPERSGNKNVTCSLHYIVCFKYFKSNFHFFIWRIKIHFLWEVEVIISGFILFWWNMFLCWEITTNNNIIHTVDLLY